MRSKGLEIDLDYCYDDSEMMVDEMHEMEMQMKIVEVDEIAHGDVELSEMEFDEA